MNNRNLLFLIMFTFLSTLFGRAATPRLNHVHPLNWWTGMQEPTLQVMLHGNNIGDCQVSLTEAKDVVVQKVERVENPNYLFVYLDLSKAQPQTFGIALTKPGKKKPMLTQPYTLEARSGKQPNAFNASDVMYLLMPDRFIDGDPLLNNVKGMKEPVVDKADDWARHGGDLKGMNDALDYLQELGVTAIWPTPVHVNDMPGGSYHGYAITDYYAIDPRLGTNEQYKALVENCHKHGIKMVMDLVFNHCGSENFLFTDLPQSDWFNFGSKFEQSGYRTAAVNDVHASRYDREHTTDGWFVSTMPDFNQRNPLVKDYLIQTSIWWVEYANIDGIRQDTYPYADFDMMRDWCVRLDKEYPGFNIVGETWINNNVGVSYWQKDSKLAPKNSMLPSVMDFPLMSLLNQTVDEETDDWNGGFAKLYEYLAQDCVYADPLNLLTFLDNHDTDRFHKTKELADNHDRYFQALTLLLTLRGIPQLYYGNEIGMYSNKANGDGPNRQNFPAEALTAAGRDKAQNQLFDFTKKLLNWRKGCKAVQFGSLTHFAVRSGCYVYARQLDGKTVTVILNGTDKAQALDLTPYREVLPASSAKDVITGKVVNLADKLELSPRNILVLDF